MDVYPNPLLTLAVLSSKNTLCPFISNGGVEFSVCPGRNKAFLQSDITFRHHSIFGSRKKQRFSMILIQLSSFFLRSFLNSFLGAGRCPAKANPARLEIGGFYLLVAPIPTMPVKPSFVTLLWGSLLNNYPHLGK